ncbi:hypothetical protein [Lentibacillus saliphilus]|uniref:hypothetical protein n=1 Tax=Lentibacillus saliphilus TaxID=2737028 RepID=UPI001C2FAE05|nr:hypothetical protein [Lentibacillus saliphilus]
MKHKRDWVIGGALLIVIIIGFNVNSSISHMKSDMEQMAENQHHRLDRMEDNIYRLSDDLTTQLKQFNQEQMWIQGQAYNVLKTDLDSNTVRVTLNWQLKELANDADVSLLVRESDNHEWQVLEVEESGGLNYAVTHTFSLNHNYDAQVIASSEESQKSAALLNLNFAEMMQERIAINAHITSLFSDSRFSVDVFIHRSEDGEGIFKEETVGAIKKATAYVYVKGKLLEEVDLLSENEYHHKSPSSEELHFIDTIELKEQTDDIDVRVIVEDERGLKYEGEGVIIN